MVTSPRPYESFFGLREEPFSIAPDPRFLYMSSKHREALELLSYGLARGASFVLLTGEIGAGKTTVWRRFLESLPSNFDVANVVNPKLDVNQLLARICDDLHVDQPEGTRTIDLIDALHGHLLLASARGRRTLIVIDEAQALSSEVLEQLRLLTNLDTSGKKLQVMLIGQPELRHMLEQPALEPLAQRIVARYHLPTLSATETVAYIEHRLEVAGFEGPLPFDGESIPLIHRLCHGVPRRINTVCDRALGAARSIGARRVNRAIVERAAMEVFGRRTAPEPVAPVAPMTGSGSLAAGKVWIAAAAVGLASAAVVWLLPPLVSVQTPAAGPAVGTKPAARAAPTAVVAAEPAAPASVAPAPAPSITSAAAPTNERMVASGEATAPIVTPPAPTANSTLPTSLEGAFVRGVADEATAWRALARQWGTVLGSGEPCVAAAQQSLQCIRSSGGLSAVRQLDRPGVLRLVDEHGRVAHVLLVALAGDNATLDFGGAERTLPLMQLARLWRGEYATFWRAPAAYRPGDIARLDGPLGRWLVQRLADVDGLEATRVSDEALRSRLVAFQIAQGLTPDGIAGPLTLMQLSQASGSGEPRLTRRPLR